MTYTSYLPKAPHKLEHRRDANRRRVPSGSVLRLHLVSAMEVTNPNTGSVSESPWMFCLHPAQGR